MKEEKAELEVVLERVRHAAKSMSFVDRQLAEVGDAVIGLLDPKVGERVLDLGCGREAALLPLARATGPTGRALGIDLAPRMVELLAQDARDLPQVEVRVSDASTPDVEAEAYGVVSCCLVLFFLPDPASGGPRTGARADARRA
ncbi:MAG: methyltransferase domain-containing protein, partial [Gemmatimonadetes bacterium]|nr:methyltransferase domain-containing protein [Gemmatimonadota bacterium]